MFRDYITSKGVTGTQSDEFAIEFITLGNASYVLFFPLRGCYSNACLKH